MKKKRYQEGGEAEGISGTAGRMTTTEAKKPRTTDDMTFGQAFRAARKAGKKTFPWRGQEYTTETKEEQDRKRAAKELKEVEVTGKRRMTTDDFMKGSDRRVGVDTGIKRPRLSMVDFKTQGRRESSEGSTSEKPKQGLRDRIRNYFEGQKKIERAKRGYNKGGRIDGCAMRGKTRGRMR